MEYALITGASMGLGAEFARQLAARHLNLVLVARSADLLDALAKELRERHAVEVRVFPCDLAQPGAAARIVEYITAERLEVTWLVNNAGFGDAGAFEDMQPGRITGSLMVNVVALTELTRLLLPMLLKKHGSRIINVSSTASFQPVPFMGVYSATKAYVTSFTEALNEELRGRGVSVLALCPGPTNTNFSQNQGMSKETFAKGQTSEHVVRVGLAASDRGAAILVTQRRLGILAVRVLPRFVVRRVAGAIARKMTKSK